MYLFVVKDNQTLLTTATGSTTTISPSDFAHTSATRTARLSTATLPTLAHGRIGQRAKSGPPPRSMTISELPRCRPGLPDPAHQTANARSGSRPASIDTSWGVTSSHPATPPTAQQAPAHSTAATGPSKIPAAPSIDSDNLERGPQPHPHRPWTREHDWAATLQPSNVIKTRVGFMSPPPCDAAPHPTPALRLSSR